MPHTIFINRRLDSATHNHTSTIRKLKLKRNFFLYNLKDLTKNKIIKQCLSIKRLSISLSTAIYKKTMVLVYLELCMWFEGNLHPKKGRTNTSQNARTNSAKFFPEAYRGRATVWSLPPTGSSRAH